MTQSSRPICAAGVALIVAGLCYLPLALLNGWQGTPAIGTSVWWAVRTLAAGHHLFLSFGLFGLYAAAVRRPGASGLGAFVAASAGNLLVAGSAAIQLTILPALAAHPEASAGLDCTPFFTPATRAATAFIEQACTPWQFGALDAWVGVGSITLLLGSIWLGAELFLARVVARPAGLLLGIGSIVRLLGVAVPLPETVIDAARIAIALAFVWCGVTLAGRSPAGSDRESR